MGRLSDKIKIIYLLLVILFAAGVFVYLLDTWGIIKLEETFTFLKQEPPKVKSGDDNPTLLELERLNKERERLVEKELQIKEQESKLAQRASELDKLKEELAEIKKGLKLEKQQLADTRAEEIKRDLLIRNMAERLGAMPPADAVAIVAGWSNSDLVDVFKRMERIAVDDGRPSIVPYLITQLPRDRAQIITTIMMDSQAGRLPAKE